MAWRHILMAPFGCVARVLGKVTTQRRRYATPGGGYDAARYWRERFEAHGMSLRSVGHEGLSEEANARMYAAAAAAFTAAAARAGIAWAGCRVLEVGCGTGFYTGIIARLGSRDCSGLDITDVFFGELRRRFPAYTFLKQDITEGAPPGQFDMVLMIDVVQHIVQRDKLDRALAHIRGSLAPGGVCLLSPVAPGTRRHLFYTHSWSAEDISAGFPGCDTGTVVPFRTLSLMIIRKP